MTASTSAVRRGCIFESIERHVNRLVANGMQHDLEALAIVERDGLVEVVLLPEGNAAAPADVGIKHGGRFGVDGAVEKSLDGAELEVGSAKRIAQFAIVCKVLVRERCFQFVFGGGSTVFRKNDGSETETKLEFSFG